MLGVASAVLAVAMSWPSCKSLSLFSLHPLCMSFGFIYFSLKAIIVMSEKHNLHNKMASKSTTNLPSRSEIGQSHFKYQSITMVLATIGFLAIYINKVWAGKNHFTSWHSWWGILTLGLFWVNYMIGIQYTFPTTSNKCRWQWKSMTHTALGSVAAYVATLGCIVAVLLGPYGQNVFGTSGGYQGMAGATVLLYVAHAVCHIRNRQVVKRNSKLI